jgi:uncharacterized protein YycO
MTVEAGPKNGVFYGKNFEGRYKDNQVWQVGVTSTSVQQDWRAGEWAGKQKNKPYNSNFYQTNNRNSFYCSQLVWAAYMYTANVNLNTSDYDIPGFRAIHPSEFVNGSKTTLIYRKR